MILDAVLLRMNAFGRIAVCGMIAGYDGAPLPLTNPALILVNRLKIEGFIVSEHMEVWPEALTELGTLVATGKLRPRETVAEGIACGTRGVSGSAQGQELRQAARETLIPPRRLRRHPPRGRHWRPGGAGSAVAWAEDIAACWRSRDERYP